jgi:hypothetical protein
MVTPKGSSAVYRPVTCGVLREVQCSIQTCDVWGSEGSAVHFARISQYLEGTCYPNQITFLNIGGVNFIKFQSIFTEARGVTSQNTGVDISVVARIRNTM